MATCSACGGRGFLLRANSSGLFSPGGPCHMCDGTGWVPDPPRFDGGIREGDGGGGETKPSKPVFPWVDDLFDRIPRWVHISLSMVTGLVGYSYGINHGYEGAELIGPAIVGAIAWPIAVGVMIAAVKGLLIAARIALLVGIGYGLYWLWTHFL